MYRLAYLIPRLILLGLAFLAASIAGDTIAERLVTAHLESSLSMDVEIGRLRTRTSGGKVFVNDLALVDPARPLTNLFQADLAFFEIDLSAISRRQLVIENARASQVRLGVPRTSAVSNPISTDQSALKTIDDATGFSPAHLGKFLANHDSIRMAWLDQFKNDTPIMAEVKKPESNQLYDLASATNQKWNKDLQQQNGQLKVVSASFAKVVSGQPSAEEIERNGINGPPNPLRGRASNQPQESKLDEIIEALERLRRQQEILERQAAADMARLEAAFQSESTSKDQPKPIEPEVSPETFSQLLLAELHERIANEAMDWFSGLRNSVTACSRRKNSVSQTQSRPSGGRGEVVEILGAAGKQPTVLKKLTFDGAGRFNQQHVNFAGEAFDITDQPSTHNLPTTFKLRAQGDQHFVLQGSIDRRSGSCSDSVTIDFPAFPLGPQNLGTESEMLVTTGPRTTAHGAIHLKVDGQAVSGTMRLDFSDVALVVEHLHDVAGGKEVALRLNQSLSTLQQFESTATFEGTLDHPHVKFESSLGETLTVAMTQIERGKVNENQVATKDEVDQFYKTQVLPLKTNIEIELDSINRSIESQIGIAQKVRTSLRTAKPRWPEMR